MKGIVKKIILVISCLALTIPFFNNIYADVSISNDFILGIRESIIDIEYKINSSSSSYNETALNDTYYPIEPNSQFVVVRNGAELGKFMGFRKADNSSFINLIYYTGNSVNPTAYCQDCYLELKITDNDKGYSLTGNENTSYNSSVNYLYKYTVIFNGDYKGYININNTTYYVNGTYLDFTSTTKINSFNLGSFNLSPNNDYRWNYPIESYSAINNLFSNGFTYEDNNSLNNISMLYKYPVFNIPANTSNNGYFLQSAIGNLQSEVYFIFFINKNVYNPITFYDYFNINNGEVKKVDVLASQLINVDYWNLVKVTISNFSSTARCRLYAKENLKFMGIYANNSLNTKYMSTEFALNYGFVNSELQHYINMLSNQGTIINLIENGNDNSNNTVNNANSKNNELSSTMNEYDNISQQYNNDFSTNLNNIDTNFNLTSVTGFVNGSNWVKSQFDILSNYVPVRLILVYSLTLGIALLLIAKRAL